MVSLAEPRRKTKMSFDPNNTTWTNDQNKFGKKLMQKMGWSDGDGLGKERKGTTDHLKVKVKNNALGLGADKQGAGDEAWQDMQASFNNLLESLTKSHTTGEVNTHKKASTRLEDKTSASRRRFYGRFVKNKDVSNYSDHDLGQIFGKRDRPGGVLASQTITTTETVNVKVDGTEECTVSGLVTTTNTTSMSEYFAKRLAERKALNSGMNSVVQDISDESCPVSEIEAETSSIVASEAEDKEEEIKKEKKAKKDRKQKKSKSKKSKKERIVEIEDEDAGTAERVEKKEKSRKRKRDMEADEHESSVKVKRVKKDKKEKKQIDSSDKKHKKTKKSNVEKKSKKSKTSKK
eukprot:CFRG3821T1